jgi:hypothetical protein
MHSPETALILRFKQSIVLGTRMRKHLSSEDFLLYLEAIWEDGPQVRYQNPDAWVRPLNVCNF